MTSGFGDFTEVELVWHDDTKYGSMLSHRLQRTVRRKLYPKCWAQLSQEMGKAPANRVRFDAEELCRLILEERQTDDHQRVVRDAAFWRPDPKLVCIGGFHISSEEGRSRLNLPAASHNCASLRDWLRRGDTDNIALALLGRDIDAALWEGSFRRSALSPSERVPVMVGHACVTWSDGEVRLWTDPFLRPKRLRYPRGQQPLSPLDTPEEKHLILITHSHADHFDPASLLLFPRDTTVIVPRVDAETPLAIDMELRVRHLDLADVRCLGWGDQVSVGSFTVTAMPFYGEQPLGPHASRQECTDRNQGSIYHVAGPHQTALFLADSGSDPAGSSLELARSIRRTFGHVDLLFGNHRRWRVYPPQYITTSVPQNLCYVPDEELGVPQAIMLTPEELDALAAAVGARHVVPYAMGNAPWFAEIGLGPDDRSGGRGAAFDAPLGVDAERDRDTLVEPSARLAVLTPGDAIGPVGRSRDIHLEPIDSAAFRGATAPQPPPVKAMTIGGLRDHRVVRDLLELTRVDPTAYLIAAPGFVEIVTGDTEGAEFLWELVGRLVRFRHEWIASSSVPMTTGVFGGAPDWRALFETCHRHASLALRDPALGLAAVKRFLDDLRPEISTAAVEGVARELLGLTVTAAQRSGTGRNLDVSTALDLPTAAAPLVAIHGAITVSRALLIVKFVHNVFLTMRAMGRAVAHDETRLFDWLLNDGTQLSDQMVERSTASDGCLWERCDAALHALCDNAGLRSDAEKILRLFRRLTEAANIRRLQNRPRWSGVTDDCTPVELSVAIGRDGSRVRFLIEAQDDPASAAVYWQAAERLNQIVIEDEGADASRLRAVADLFTPTDPGAFLAAWHSVEFAADRPPLFKIYLNPASRGPLHASEVMSEALTRLGFGAALPAVANYCCGGDVFTHLSLDLTDHMDARVKVYVRHVNTNVPDLIDRLSSLGLVDEAEIEKVCRIVCGGSMELRKRPVMTCLHLTEAERRHPTGAALYIPLFPYARDDRVAAERICALLDELALPKAGYVAAIASLTDGDAASEGLHTYVSYQRGAKGGQVSTYFNPRFFQRQFGRLALDPPRFWPSPVA